jgi:hypothetical protein
MAKLDTVGYKFYRPLRWVEAAGGWLFWIVAILSFAAIYIDKVAYPDHYQYVQVAFLVFAFLYFVQGQAQRLYFFPRAEDARHKELLSDSFGAALTHEKTIGYYNNSHVDPIKS